MSPNADQGDRDILDELVDLLQKNGTATDAERNRVYVLVFMEIIHQLRKVEQQSMIGAFKRQPVKFTATVGVAFILLYEFSTYINIHILLGALLKLLGVPVP